MSLFFNKEIKTNSTYPVDSLIHAFSKKVFEDYDEAELMLLRKVLLPGEVAFAYYKDPDAEHGLNVIFAVGPVKNGTGNVIFKNSDEINKLIQECKVIEENIYNTYKFVEL
jgi:hypothetical protein